MNKATLATKKKSEIIEAYEELLDKIEKQKQSLPPEQQRKVVEEKAAVARAHSLSNEQIVRSCAELKLQLTKALDNLEVQLTAEYRKFTDIQKSIDIESARLEEIHQITLNADSLAALLAAQKERKEFFEAEMAKREQELEEAIAEKRGRWEKEKEGYVLKKVEEEQANNKARDREEEEYQYQLTLLRKRDEDVYQTKKAELEAELASKKEKLEKELADREAFIQSQEEEFQKLKEEASAFPAKLQSAVSEAEERLSETLCRQYTFERELAGKGEEGEKRLLKEKIANLEAKIKEQEKRLEQLTHKADQSTQQVQEIAVRAIDGARPVQAFNEKLLKELATPNVRKES